jgi:hypothetical protein
MRLTPNRKIINKPTDFMLDQEFEEIADRQRSIAILFSLGAAVFVAWAFASGEEIAAFSLGLIGAVYFLIVSMAKGSKARENRTKCNEYKVRRRQLEDLFEEEDPTTIERGIRQLRAVKLAPHFSFSSRLGCQRLISDWKWREKLKKSR